VIYFVREEVINLTATTIRLERAEEDALDAMVRVGLFPSKDEAARAAIIKYAADLGLMSPEMLWQKITKHKRRKVSPAQLQRDIEAACSEA
jgi:Arc/MetJ-type ribon-helix-helix transcriptional regulator